jgi:hypothetical protein
MIMPYTRDAKIPPTKRKDLLLENMLMAVKLVKAVAVYKTACRTSSG